jgi:hypothetical protein
MTYSKKKFALQLQEKILQGKDYIKISKWAFQIYSEQGIELEKGLDNIVMSLIAMEKGPEFIISNEDLLILAKQLHGITKLTIEDVKTKFLDVIQGKISLEEANDWAWNMMQIDELEQLEYESKDSEIIFEGLGYLHGVDLQEAPGSYLHSMKNVEDKFDQLFHS